jgi:mRNA interferase MazF
VTRGEVYRVNLSPTKGSEQQGAQRPCLIVQRTVPAQYDVANPMTIIVPLTHAEGKSQTILCPFVPKGVAGTTKDSLILCQQVRAIARSRMGGKMGDMPANIMTLVDAGLRAVLDL